MFAFWWSLLQPWEQGFVPSKTCSKLRHHSYPILRGNLPPQRKILYIGLVLVFVCVLRGWSLSIFVLQTLCWHLQFCWENFFWSYWFPRNLAWSWNSIPGNGNDYRPIYSCRTPLLHTSTLPKHTVILGTVRVLDLKHFMGLWDALSPSRSWYLGPRHLWSR